MNKKTLIGVTFCFALSLSMPVRANAGGAPPEDLAAADWSVNAAHNLASNPPSLETVQDFENRFWGASEGYGDKVCEFRFADLRSSGNLSLIVSVAPGSWGCTKLYIFDKTPKGFELYSGPVAHDLANSVLDMNHDGRHELVLWRGLAPFAMRSMFNTSGLRLGCDAEWPLVFTWTGNGYSEVGDQYKDYYRNYLKSVEARLAAYSSELEPASAQTANPAPAVGGATAAGQMFNELSPGHGGGAFFAPTPGAAPTPEAAAIPEWAALNQARREYPCARIEAAKTEAFLGIDSASTMSAAIKDSESDDPNKRITGAVIFSYLGSQEAGQDLKTLSNDADSKVAEIAKRAASFGEDPAPSARTISREPDFYIHLSEPQQSKH